ncbi:hypothetical protein K474DRAFT_717182 [Panus rudis PR-1116 ss-1]|nr:hypothetical protein K474DRAFT_717182 [Panus rudis PR-1116 ss-1]
MFTRSGSFGSVYRRDEIPTSSSPPTTSEPIPRPGWAGHFENGRYVNPAPGMKPLIARDSQVNGMLLENHNTVVDIDNSYYLIVSPKDGSASPTDSSSSISISTPTPTSTSSSSPGPTSTPLIAHMGWAGHQSANGYWVEAAPAMRPPPV